jgi:hypothetical protein
MPGNATVMLKAGPITSAAWPRSQPGATRAPIPGAIARPRGDCAREGSNQTGASGGAAAPSK